ncbi:MAG: hypothetical protein LBB10_02785 [Bifidobacteriaceae bacterium]|jgi:hypothetical protein|nr:hypothetical protein [Bifidobacteriaceae bacterium]
MIHNKKRQKTNLKIIGLLFTGIVCLSIFSAIIFMGIASTNAAKSSSVYPIEKGGTGTDNPNEAARILGLVTEISASSNDRTFPSARSVYNFSKSKTVWNSGNVNATKYTQLNLVLLEITGTTNTTDGALLGTLPADYWPSAAQNFLVYPGDGSAIAKFGYFTIAANGAINYYNKKSQVGYKTTVFSYSTD